MHHIYGRNHCVTFKQVKGSGSMPGHWIKCFLTTMDNGAHDDADSILDFFFSR